MEERFVGVSVEEDSFEIYDRQDNNNHLNLEEILDLLNKQDEEIKFLQKKIEIIKYSLKSKGLWDKLWKSLKCLEKDTYDELYLQFN